jgi:hypothetical protein
MVARLFLVAVMAILAWLVGRLVRGVAGGMRTAPPGARTPEPMVRDRVCNTFLPRSRALVAESEGFEHFFCSDRCRRLFLERRSTVS